MSENTKSEKVENGFFLVRKRMALARKHAEIRWMLIAMPKVIGLTVRPADPESMLSGRANPRPKAPAAEKKSGENRRGRKFFALKRKENLTDSSMSGIASVRITKEFSSKKEKSRSSMRRDAAAASTPSEKRRSIS